MTARIFILRKIKNTKTITNQSLYFKVLLLPIYFFFFYLNVLNFTDLFFLLSLCHLANGRENHHPRYDTQSRVNQIDNKLLHLKKKKKKKKKKKQSNTA